MKRSEFLRGFLTAGAIVVGVSLTHASEKLNIVTTLPDLKSIADEVGGNRVEVFAIATGFQNPHFVDPKPSYILKLSKADIFVTVGLDLESGWVPSLLNSARNPRIIKGGEGYVDASTDVPLLQVPSSVSRAEGDIHIYGNPHYWLDPENGKIIAQNIYQALVRMDREGEVYYSENLRRFKDKLDTKIQEWTAMIRPLRGTKIIAYHNEWPYFEQRFGLQIVDFLEPKPGIPPTASQLARVIREMLRDNIKVIITSPYFTTDSAELVARNVGGKVVTLATSVGAEEHVRTYINLFDYNVAKIVEALK